MDKLMSWYQCILDKYGKLRRILEILFLGLLFLYVASRVLQTTSFDAYSVIVLIDFSTRMLFWVTVLKTFFVLRRKRELIVACAAGAVLCAIYFFRPSTLLYVFGILLFGSIGMDYRRILKGQVLAVALVVLTAVVASLTGTIEHLIYLWDGGKLRDSFGICYPTDFASYLFYVLIFFWIAWQQLPHWVSLLLCLPFLCVANQFALSDTCTICGLGFLAVLLLFLLAERFLKEDGRLRKYKKILDGLLVLAFPLFALLMFGLIFLYAKGTGIGLKMNAWLTGRLGLAYNAFVKHGITLFGSSLSQQGNGFSTFPVFGYDFVDSTYPLVLIRDGWIFFLLLAFTWMRTTCLAIRAKDYRLAFGMGLIALHSFVEHHFTEANYNILMFLPCALYAPEKEGTAMSDAQMVAQKDGTNQEGTGRLFPPIDRMKLGICTAVTTGVILLTSPVWLSGMRTICGWKRFLQDETADFFVVATVFFMVVIAVTLIYGAAGIWQQRADRKSATAPWVSLAVAGILLVTGGIYSGILLGRAEKETKELLATDAPVLAEVNRVAAGRIYSTEFPVLYRKSLSKLRYGVFTGEDLARYSNATVIVPRGTEYYVFFRKGFSYAAISADTALYTNDEKVIQCLMAQGFQPKEYFDEVRFVELPIHMAPATNLRKGTYTITYRFHVTEGEEKPENVAEITIVGDGGYTRLANQMIPADGMDENGDAECVLKLRLERDVPGIRFYLLGREGCSIEVREVSYQMIP